MPKYAIAAVTGQDDDGSPRWISKRVFIQEEDDDAAATTTAKDLIAAAGITGEQLALIKVEEITFFSAHQTIQIDEIPTAPAE